MNSKLHEHNYFNVQSFMVKDLGLKGNELVVFAVIYGFSQAEDQAYTGGLQYLADWTNSTKQGVIKNLKSLIDKGYITKNERYINGVKICEYRSTKFNGVLNKVEQGVLNNVEWGIKQSLPNNKSDKKLLDNKHIRDIVAYLNERAGVNFKATADKTVSLISARINEGYSVEDFKKVIDNKVAEWKDDHEMARFIRPMTLFGTKFESYLNQKTPPEKNKLGGQAYHGDSFDTDDFFEAALRKNYGDKTDHLLGKEKK